MPNGPQMHEKTVVIDCFPASVARYASTHVVVCVDVFRATTTAATAVAAGRRCFVASTVEDAVELARRLEDPLLVGEVGGNMPYGFDLTNSPAAIAELSDPARPMVLVSSSGTPLLVAAQSACAAYVGSLRDYAALADHLARRAQPIALVGAGSRGEFREEDQLCCARIAVRLLDHGITTADDATATLIERWRSARPDAIVASASVDYLRRTGQLHDLDFVLNHVDDLDAVLTVEHDEVVPVRG
jgi:2-phosphosulfolactate phosphatase